MPKPKSRKKPGDTAVATVSATAAAALVPVARFDPNGGPVRARVSSGFAQPGAYELLLWEAGKNEVVMEERGNFLNAEDDEYPLPLPNAKHHGRHAQVLVTVAITPPVLTYAVALTVSQDGNALATDLKSGTGQAGDAITRTLWVRLEAP